MSIRDELIELIDRTTNTHDNKVHDAWLTDLVDAILARYAVVKLPEANGRCICTSHAQDAGCGYTEMVLEYEPACPEHSQHVYDPRAGAWIEHPSIEEAQA
jgi:hypothetical protein